jgi:hypothetical protein
MSTITANINRYKVKIPNKNGVSASFLSQDGKIFQILRDIGFMEQISLLDQIFTLDLLKSNSLTKTYDKIGEFQFQLTKQLIEESNNTPISVQCMDSIFIDDNLYTMNIKIVSEIIKSTNINSDNINSDNINSDNIKPTSTDTINYYIVHPFFIIE